MIILIICVLAFVIAVLLNWLYLADRYIRELQEEQDTLTMVTTLMQHNDYFMHERKFQVYNPLFKADNFTKKVNENNYFREFLHAIRHQLTWYEDRGIIWFERK